MEDGKWKPDSSPLCVAKKPCRGLPSGPSGNSACPTLPTSGLNGSHQFARNTRAILSLHPRGGPRHDRHNRNGARPEANRSVFAGRTCDGFLFTAQIALDPKTNTLLEGDVQTERVPLPVIRSEWQLHQHRRSRPYPLELRLTSSETLRRNTPQNALRTRKNTINQSAVTSSASGRFVVDKKM